MQSLLWSIAVVAVLRLAWMVLECWMDVVVTDKHFMITFGVITRKTYVMSTTKVVDLSFLRPVAGQLLGYGTLRVELADQKQDVKMVKYLPRPEQIFMAITHLILDEQQPRSHVLAPTLPRRCERFRFWLR
jgi:uncharacterized membrane protein YdbT with pleckstrin-like domain